jgi:hypothetical protein
MKLTTHHKLVQRLRTRGIIPPFPQYIFMASCCIKQKMRLRSMIFSQAQGFIYKIHKKALTVLRGPLTYPNGLLDLHIETFVRTPWLGDQTHARPLSTQNNTTQTSGHTSMPQAGFESAIPMFKRS